MHVDLGGYHIRDVVFSAAFDIDVTKVGKDVSEAIWAGQNNTLKISDVPNLGVPVHRGMTHDGLGKYLKEKIEKAPGETDDIVSILKETKTDVLVSYLPVGSEEATKWYVEQALAGGCAFADCTPSPTRPRPTFSSPISQSGPRRRRSGTSSRLSPPAARS